MLGWVCYIFSWIVLDLEGRLGERERAVCGRDEKGVSFYPFHNLIAVIELSW